MLGLKNRVAGLSHRPVQKTQWFNTPENFGLRAQLLHMVIGLAVIAMLVLGLTLDMLPLRFKGLGYMVHKALGIWILGATILWFLHWLFQVTPAPLPDQAKEQFRLAKLIHKIMLGLCILMPLSGWMMYSAWTGQPVTIWPGFTVPPLTYKDPAFARAMLGLHILLSWILMALVALHVLAALYHHFYRRDNALKRILPRFKPPGGNYRHQFTRGVNKTNKLR